jgi:hypothetical protein
VFETDTVIPKPRSSKCQVGAAVISNEGIPGEKIYGVPVLEVWVSEPPEHPMPNASNKLMVSIATNIFMVRPLSPNFFKIVDETLDIVFEQKEQPIGQQHSD